MTQTNPSYWAHPWGMKLILILTLISDQCAAPHWKQHMVPSCLHTDGTLRLNTYRNHAGTKHSLRRKMPPLNTGDMGGWPCLPAPPPRRHGLEGMLHGRHRPDLPLTLSERNAGGAEIHHLCVSPNESGVSHWQAARGSENAAT